MKLRDLWPMILTAPLLAVPLLDWRLRLDDLNHLVQVDGHVVVVNKYRCPSRHTRTHGGNSVCYELIVEYKTADGSVHRKLEYQNISFNAKVGALVPIYIDPRNSGSPGVGASEEDYWAPTRGLAIMMVGIFTVASYASYRRVQRRRELERA
jgi:hypothetical protein